MLPNVWRNSASTNDFQPRAKNRGSHCWMISDQRRVLLEENEIFRWLFQVTIISYESQEVKTTWNGKLLRLFAQQRRKKTNSAAFVLIFSSSAWSNFRRSFSFQRKIELMWYIIYTFCLITIAWNLFLNWEMNILTRPKQKLVTFWRKQTFLGRWKLLKEGSIHWSVRLHIKGTEINFVKMRITGVNKSNSLFNWQREPAECRNVKRWNRSIMSKPVQVEFVSC